jgi:hypothetical protein
MPGGRFDSSRTRVRPFFGTLMERDPTGRSWLADLLAAAPHPDAVPVGVREGPGTLEPRMSTIGADRLLGCFEFPAPPSAPFLGWLIEHPERMTWPPGASFGAETERRRRALLEGSGPEREAAIAEALAALERAGAAGSRRRWWAFEGFTSVDCCLMTERLVLFVEGKRTEPLSSSTNWFPSRNQLVRNLEVVAHVAPDRPAAVLLVTEDPIEEIDDAALRAGTPHLTEPARAELPARYLGQVTWRDLCAALDVDFASLPDEVDGA